MDRNDILYKVQDIFHDVFDDNKIVLKDAMTSKDIAGWDSLIHIELVVEIENKFNIKFVSKEISDWKTVGDTINSIMDKLSAKK
jgi:acyl carrier protein